MIGKCPGCGFSPKTRKTRDPNKHMKLTRDRPYQALLQLTRNTQPITNSNLQSRDPNARKLDESVKQWGSRLQKKVKELSDKDREREKREEQGFFDEPEIEEANFQHEPSLIVQPEIDLEAGPGPRTQAHHEDLDIEVPWPVPFPDDKEHRAI
ncbi:hypothetical protein F8M41_023027 [Gigaspora margarita]|uniref:Uncharacterized protein n=1 Tax=Gigaspora margarita TaxID=4874 RepID=A0A8H4AE69_GIGMA|nr:hypothetical protein F8M41_023027 [Gigaspora margarita]